MLQIIPFNFEMLCSSEVGSSLKQRGDVYVCNLVLFMRHRRTSEWVEEVEETQVIGGHLSSFVTAFPSLHSTPVVVHA